MRIIESGKYKGKILAECPREYVDWAAKHEKNFAERNRWVSWDAKILLERMAQAATLATYEARKEAEIAIKIAERLISNASQGNLHNTRAFSLLR